MRSVGANCVEDSGGAIFGAFVDVTVGWIVGSSVTNEEGNGVWSSVGERDGG